MPSVRAAELAVVAIGLMGAAPAKAASQPPASGRVEGQERATITVTPQGQDGDLHLQLEVFVNGRSLQMLFPFTLRADGTLLTSLGELQAMGLRLPAGVQFPAASAIPLHAIPGVTFRYDEAGQAVYLTLAAEAQRPTLVGVDTMHPPSPGATRPPLGALLNYTLFASATDGEGGPRFGGVSGAFEARLFGPFGLVEHSFIGRTGTGGRFVRLETAYIWDDPDRLTTFRAGDTISGGFAWTRPIRLGGLQFRRSFGLRPDLVTVAVPTLDGSAAAPSSLDLYVNEVRTLSADVPLGPYRIAQPPIIDGSGQARLVLHDALGRETVTTTSFYASPELLAPGLTDFSIELGFARRNYAVTSYDYDRRLAFSGSIRRGINPGLTLSGHVEAAGGCFASIGGGATFTLGHIALGSVTVAGSRTPASQGALVNVSLESRTRFFSILLRTQQVFGDYQDLASWTAATRANLPGEESIYGQPRSIDQANLSAPLWRGASAGISYVQLRRRGDRSRVASLSFTQDFGRFTV